MAKQKARKVLTPTAAKSRGRKPRQLAASSRFSIASLAMFVLLFGGIGAYVLIKSRAATPTLSHFLGGFGVESDADIANASADGVQDTLIYGYAPLPTDPVGMQLIAHNMKLIDAMPEEYLRYYECHLNNTCPASIYPELTSVQALMMDVTNHLQIAKNNSLVAGYWTLDDWNFGDGTGKDLLVQINNLIHQITPGRPSICGFGGEIGPLPGNEVSWSDGTAANFSPQGCDMVGLYVYGERNTTGSYDWTMANILPAIFTSLQNRGWDQSQTPLVGIPQAFGGDFVGDGSWPVPTAQSVETQAKTYCQQGATGIIYYAWSDGAPTSTSQLPSNSVDITQGIKNGNTDCQSLWASTSPPPVPSPPPPATNPNKITNGSFENTGRSWLSPWAFQFSGIKAKVAQDNTTQADGKYSLKAYIPKTGTCDCNVQVNQANVPITAGSSYGITFWAKASAPRTMRLSVVHGTSPATSYFSTSVSLTTSWQQYTASFQAPQSDTNSMLQFNMANAVGYVWVDNVSLQ